MSAEIDAVVRRIDAAIEHRIATRKGLEVDIERLSKARKMLVGGKPRKRGPVKASSQAGEQNVSMVEDLLARLGTATQAEITKASKLNSGTVSYALGTLRERGVAEATGKRVGRSKEYRYARADAAVSNGG